jgi:hypothetical protein
MVLRVNQLLILLFSMILTACGGTSGTTEMQTYTISGTITGMATGSHVVLVNNNSNPITITGNGAFEFTVPIVLNGAFNVSVFTQPVGQICTVSSGYGAGLIADVNNVVVVCSSNTYSISGAVHGLIDGEPLVLENNKELLRG